MTAIIIVTKRQDDFHASVAGHPEIWECGKTYLEAIGNLVITHIEMFNICGVVIYPFGRSE
jgi:hypothetical protein